MAKRLTPQERHARRKDRFVVGYVGTGNGVLGSDLRESGHVGTADPMTLPQAERLLEKLPCTGAAIYELRLVRVGPRKRK